MGHSRMWLCYVVREVHSNLSLRAPLTLTVIGAQQEHPERHLTLRWTLTFTWYIEMGTDVEDKDFNQKLDEIVMSENM